MCDGAIGRVRHPCSEIWLSSHGRGWSFKRCMAQSLRHAPFEAPATTLRTEPDLAEWALGEVGRHHFPGKGVPGVRCKPSNCSTQEGGVDGLQLLSTVCACRLCAVLTTTTTTASFLWGAALHALSTDERSLDHIQVSACWTSFGLLARRWPE